MSNIDKKLHANRRILIGGSAGSIDHMLAILETTKRITSPPIIVVMHMAEFSNHQQFADLLQSCTSLKVVKATNNQQLQDNTVYLAAGNYHVLLSEEGQTMHLYDDEPYNFSKPSIDILFYSCIGTEAKSTKALLLSGANSDGAESIRALYEAGADCVVVDPKDCRFSQMPLAALNLCPELEVLPLAQIANWMQNSKIHLEGIGCE